MKPDGSRQSFGSALANAAKGVTWGIKNERNIKIDCCIAVVAIALGFALRVSPVEWLAIVICIAVVLALETLNTAIEAAIDLVSPEYNPLAGRAKDAAAGACLVVSVGALIVGVIIFAPKLLACMGLV